MQGALARNEQLIHGSQVNKMRLLNGVSINPGIFMGTAKLVQSPEHRITRTHIGLDGINTEQALFQKALADTAANITAFLDAESSTGIDTDIIQTHLMILQDPDIITKVNSLIRDELMSAPLAVKQGFAEIVRMFDAIENDFFAQRAHDYRDVANNLLHTLLGTDSDMLGDSSADTIPVLSEITPSQVTAFGKKGIRAYVTQRGSITSHASILTRALDITALASIGELGEAVHDGDILIVDGINAQLIVSPDEQTLQQYQELLHKYDEEKRASRQTSMLPSVTLHGREIAVRCNIELPEEAAALEAKGAEGIGLFRTEFLYLGRSRLPGEDEQYAIYSEIAANLAPHPVTIRTFDLGGDKLSHLIPSTKEENPYLGCRGIRFSLTHTEIFKTQLRAVLRASVYGNIKLMFPMVIDAQDFIRAKQLVEECKQELTAKGQSYDAAMPLGVMIEIPAAAISADALAEQVDFFSIGTNDLVQYTLAVDRNNDALADYYIQHHPAVLNLMRITIQAARRRGIPVSICGEMASMPEYIPLLVGMGVDEISVSPTRYESSKAIIRRCDAALDELLRDHEFGSMEDTEDLIFNQTKPYYHS